jgi:mannosyltransferase OCH1-like enzyme
MSSFLNLMKNKPVKSWDTVPNADWNSLESLYDDFLSNTNYNQNIPKKIHQIWLGEMPENHKKLIPKIIENHPEWEYKLWLFDDLKNYPMMNKNIYDSISNLGAKSDIARYEILYSEGGIYLDSDFDMVKSFNSLIHNHFFTGVGHANEPMVFNGLIGSQKKHKLLKNLLNKLQETFITNKNFFTDGDPMFTTGPYFFSKVFFDYVKNYQKKEEKIVVLPTPYFYPLPATERHKIRGKENEYKDFIYSYVSDETICIHLWYNSWQ